MNIIILGAGEIGLHLATQLVDLGHAVCVLESNEALANSIQDRLDGRVIGANGASVTQLGEAGAAEADLFLGLTSSDHSNLVASSLAKSMGTKKTIARVHMELQREEWLFDYRRHFAVDHLFSPERLAAVDLARFIRNPNALLVEEIARGRIELQQTTVQEGSKAVGRSLKALALPPRVRIGWLKRGTVEIVPSASEVIQTGDLLTLFGEPRKLESTLDAFSKNKIERKPQNIVIFGGGDYGFALAQMLESGAFRSRIIERDPKLCRELSNTLQNCTVINGDATSLSELKEEQVGDADVFVAASSNDEDNVMTCLQAKHLGARHCVTLIHRADYAEAISRNGSGMGIHGAVSPRMSVSRDLLRFVTADPYHTLVQLGESAELLECHVSPGSQAAEHKVSELSWPESTGLVALLHGNNAQVPAADDRIQAGDTLIAIVAKSTKRSFLRLLS